MDPDQIATTEAICREAIERLLRSISMKDSGGGLSSSFFFGHIGARLFERRMGTEIFYDSKALTEATLFVRQHGPAHLRQMDVRAIQSLLQNFVIDHFWPIGEQVMFNDVQGDLADAVSWRVKNVLAGHLAASSIFTPETGLTLYPLVPVVVQEDFDGAVFSFLRPASLTHSWLGIHPSNPLSPDHFSCISPDRKRELVTAWLGVRAPNFEVAEKRKAAILGALALTLPRHERKLFSGRHNFGGRCTFSSSDSTESFGDPPLPSLMHDATIEGHDHAWLHRLGEKLTSEDGTDVKHCRALEYFYRAWPLKPNESFSHIFMAMDSIFGDASRATQAIIDAAAKHGADTFPYERLRLLLSLRATVIHGGAPDVHDSGKYHKYYADYGEDPIVDIEKITAQCFRAVIFDEVLQERPDRREEIRAAALASRPSRENGAPETR
ncbi:hypothetical protein GWE18_10330 [Bradyrhizobium sp. CSA112]|uniref:hypothetical protein n=1 Tax=Bradyrhizobium sp. CSA112 TaxID=2699170 RepID=UPI0023B1FFCE|nr:hypothetical protein [Bradyrhizobium sp. CSA112]MDE5453258.1 hypothetical protein [Bradyrhizobium sp. CSA112]